MEKELLQAILEADTEAVCKHLIAASKEDLETWHGEIKNDAFKADTDPFMGTQRMADIFDHMRFVSRFGASGRGVDSDRWRFLHRKIELQEAAVNVIKGRDWSKAQKLADKMVREAESWWLTFRLVEEGLATIPERDEWLKWMPYGFYSYCKVMTSDDITYEETVVEVRRRAVDLLENRGFADLFHQLLEHPVAAKICASYRNWSTSGISSDVRPPGEPAFGVCIGWQHVRWVIERGDPTAITAHRDRLYNALAASEQSQTAVWYGGLLEHVYDDADLLERDLAPLLANPNASVVKWTLAKTKPLLKDGTYPLARYAADLQDAMPLLAKGTAKSVLKQLGSGLKKQPDAAPAAALAAASALLMDDAKVQTAALDLLEKTGLSSDSAVAAALDEAEAVIKPSVRDAFASLRGSAGGTAKPAGTEPAPAAKNAPANPSGQTAEAPADAIVAIADIPELIEVATDLLLRPRSALDYLRVVDALCRFERPAEIPPLGALQQQLAIGLYRQPGERDPIVAQIKALGWDTNPKKIHTLYGPDVHDQSGQMSAMLARMFVAWLGIPPAVDSEYFYASSKDAANYVQAFEDSKGAVGAPEFMHDTPFSRWAKALEKRIFEQPSFLLLSLPSHADFQLAPAILVDRLRQHTDPLPVDLAMALLRLAPDGREAARADAEKLDGPSAALLAYALGGAKPSGEADPEALACAELVRSPPAAQPPKYAVPPEYTSRSGHSGRIESRRWGCIIDVETSSPLSTASPAAPDFDSLDQLPQFVHAMHRRRISYWYDQVGSGGFEPMMADWYLGLVPCVLDSAYSNALSLFLSMADTDTIYVNELAAVLNRRLDGRYGPIPDAGYFFLAANLGLSRNGTRDLVTDTLIGAAGQAAFDAARIGRYFAWILQFENDFEEKPATCGQSLKCLSVVTGEGGAAAQIAAQVVLGMLPLELDPPPRGLNKLLDIVTEVRIDQGGPDLSPEALAWLDGVQAKGVLGKAVKALRATVS